ncbi:uncharacterized protein LOC108266428 isoform X2 [Ictalurus punctatus]|uniref:Uncharacterized protein LOC108266428 isoform X2 n=1 Tax=Ictalurus punctatus TaxID=7998 RepID=A0A9F7TIN5_ICTPU|nr:uncharacterized protein LOC108266428 isoform X2 [Ictalurus punctatus]
MCIRKPDACLPGTVRNTIYLTLYFVLAETETMPPKKTVKRVVGPQKRKNPNPGSRGTWSLSQGASGTKRGTPWTGCQCYSDLVVISDDECPETSSQGQLNPRSREHNQAIQRPVAVITPQSRAILQTTLEDTLTVSDDDSCASDVSDADEGQAEEDVPENNRLARIYVHGLYYDGNITVQTSGRSDSCQPSGGPMNRFNNKDTINQRATNNATVCDNDIVVISDDECPETSTQDQLNPRSREHNQAIQRPVAVITPQSRAILQTTQVEDTLTPDYDSCASDVCDADEGQAEEEGFEHVDNTFQNGPDNDIVVISDDECPETSTQDQLNPRPREHNQAIQRPVAVITPQSRASLQTTQVEVTLTVSDDDSCASDLSDADKGQAEEEGFEHVDNTFQNGPGMKSMNKKPKAHPVKGVVGPQKRKNPNPAEGQNLAKKKRKSPACVDTSYFHNYLCADNMPVLALIQPNVHFVMVPAGNITVQTSGRSDSCQPSGGPMNRFNNEDTINQRATNNAAVFAQRDKIDNSQTGNKNIQDENLLFLRKNRVELIDRVKNVPEILDRLKLSNEKAAIVRAERTDQERMRKLLEFTTSTHGAKFLVTALWSCASDVMEDLTNTNYNDLVVISDDECPETSTQGQLNLRSREHKQAIQRPVAVITPQSRPILQTTQVEDTLTVSDDDSCASDVSDADEGQAEEDVPENNRLEEISIAVREFLDRKAALLESFEHFDNISQNAPGWVCVQSMHSTLESMNSCATANINLLKKINERYGTEMPDLHFSYIFQKKEK